MKISALYTIVLTFSVLLDLVLSAGWWMDQPYGEATNFNIDVEYEQNITLECVDSRTEGRTTEFMYWIRPDLTVMVNGFEEYFKTLDGPAGWIVEDNKLTLQFVQETHFGFYYCLLYDAPENIYVKVGVNYMGPYFGDLWEKYELNVIIGCSAAGGFLLACAIIYVVHHFCVDSSDHGYDEDEEDDVEMGPNAKKIVDNIEYPGVEKSGFQNGAYVRNASAGSDNISNDYEKPDGYAEKSPVGEYTTQL